MAGTKSKTKFTEQHIQNVSFDETFEMASRLIWAYDSTSGTLRRVEINASGELIIAPLPAGTEIINGQKTVTAAGTAEVLATTTTIRSVTIKALPGNTNNVYVGDSSVSSSNGFVLDAGESIDLDLDNLATIYLDVDTNGEGVSYVATN